MNKTVYREEIYNYLIQEYSESSHDEITNLVDHVMNGDYVKWFDEVFCGKRSMQ